MRFRDFFSLRHIVFAVVLIAIMMGFAVRQSNNTVKVYWGDSSLEITSAKYSLSVPYEVIDTAELTPMADPGERISHAYDDDILRAGVWHNEVWGEYHIVADLDVGECILLRLNDGRLFVFNRKNSATTQEIYQELLTHIG